MRLTTFQLEARCRALTSGQRYAVPWEKIERSWLPAYQWLAARWQEQSRESMTFAPVWCWQRLADDLTAADCAQALFSQEDLKGGIIMLELDVPPSLVLLSSYSVWNELLYEVIQGGRMPPGDAHRSMFEASVLRDKDDSLQAIIPYIESEWIVSLTRMDFSDVV